MAALPSTPRFRSKGVALLDLGGEVALGNPGRAVAQRVGGLDLVMDNLNTEHSELKYSNAKLLQQVLATTTDNKNYVVEKGLDKAVAITSDYTRTITVDNCSDQEDVCDAEQDQNEFSRRKNDPHL